jgi:hypothetical protein
MHTLDRWGVPGENRKIPFYPGHSTSAILTLKVREIIFSAGKTYNGAFPGIFLGGLDLFDPNIVWRAILGSKRSRSLEKSQEMPHDMFCPRKKIISRTLKSEVHWYFYVPEREKERERERVCGERGREGRET